MKIREILRRKGHEVVTIPGERTVAEAIRLLVNHGIGSVVVTRPQEEGGGLEGILTERDVLRLVDREPETLSRRTVAEFMTRDVLVAEPGDDVGYLMEVMTRNRIRHLPVMEGDELRGLISIGDVVNALRNDVEAENRYLREYVQGQVR